MQKKLTENQEKINFLELATDLQYLQNDLLIKINEKAIPKHLPPMALIKLGLLEKCSLNNDFTCLGVIPSIDLKDEPKIVKPTLFNKDGEIWLYDSKLKPYKKVESENILDWVIGSGGYAVITIDEIELTVNTSANKAYLEDTFNLNKTKNCELIADYLNTPLKPCLPLKSRVFEIDKVYEVIKVHNERGSYYEKENDVFVDTGLLVDLKIDDKNIIENVICNSALERLIEGKKEDSIKFKIVAKKEISKNKIQVVIIDASKTTKKVNFDDLELI